MYINVGSLSPSIFIFVVFKIPANAYIMLMLEHFLQDILESMGQFVDGLKFTGGSHSLMPKTFIKEITDMAHRHNVYVSTGDWAEHLLREGPGAFKHYVEV